MYLALLGMLWLCPSLEGQENSFTINKIEMKAEPGWEVENGKNLTLTCLVDIISTTSKLQSQHQVLFYKDDVLLRNITSQNKEEDYFIQAARIYHRGNYKCTVILNNKEKTTRDYSVSVKGVPNPRVTVDKMEVMEGGMVRVECSVPEEKPPIHFTIEKLEMNVLKQKKEKMALQENYAVLEFPIEERDLVLIFQCQAKISLGNFLEASEFTKSDLVTVREAFSTPRFQITPKGEITEGDPLKLKCTIQVTHMFLEDCEIIIQKDREIVAYAKHETEVSFSTSIAKVEHMGTYTCKVESSKISKANSIFINITELFSKPKLLVSSKHLDEGGKLDLSCQITGSSEPANFTIQKENITITNFRNFTKMVWEHDSGTYRCQAAIRNVVKESDPVEISVFEIVSKPRIFHNSKSEVIKGQPLNLYCQSTNGTPPLTYYLCKMNVCESQQEMYSNAPAIFQDTPIATTEYICVAKNHHSQGSVTSDVLNVVVIVPVTKVNLTTMVQEVESGQDIVFWCSTDGGSFPIHYKIYKHNAEIPFNETTLNATQAIWHTLKVSKKEEGQYYCTASNRANNINMSPKSNIITIKVTLALWMKSLIAVFLIGSIIIALVLAARWYFKKEKAKQMLVEMSRPGLPLNSKAEKIQSDNNMEANSHSVSSDDIGNHTMKPTNEHKESDHLNMDVEYTEVEVLTPDLHRAPERKGTETVYSEIRKADSRENRHSRIEGSLDAT